jgi:uncharacterized protein (TIGR03067 family)
MHWLSLFVIAATLGLAFAPAPFPKSSRRDVPVDDLQRMQGRWDITEHRTGGRPQGEAGFTLTVESGRWTFAIRGQERSRWNITLTPTAMPREVDMKHAGDGGTLLKAIYRFDGDTLTVCYSLGGARPTRFEGDGSNWLMVLKRSGK